MWRMKTVYNHSGRIARQMEGNIYIGKRTIAFLIVSILSLSLGYSQPKVTLQSLLQEMVSRESIAKLPLHTYKNLQASSYDRRSINHNNGWYANGDRSYFVKVEEKDNGRYEHVMMESEGSGAIVRFWAVTSNVNLLEGTLRFYIDGASNPTFSGTLENLIGGEFFTGYPLSMELAKENDREKRGRNLYLPIPFAESIKVTYETKDGRKLIEGEAAWPNDAVFYNINYRLYENSVQVESLSAERLEGAKDLITLTKEKLLLADVSEASNKSVNSLNGKILPEEIKELVLESPSAKGGAINQISLKIDAENLPQALRSTILEISFDGEQTVWAPVGDFFGTGYQKRPSKHWYGTVDITGLMECKWVMPFSKTCTIKLQNLGDQEVNIIIGEVAVVDWEWDERSMNFGAAWQQYTNINSKPDRDLNFVSLEGEGVYVGDALALFDTDPGWWGEGDEKIFVDDDVFPSHFGTGTEDYYGYAWCQPAPFSSPLVLQPDGSANESVGYTLNARYRLLDGIPFSKKLKFDMELMHWGESRLNYAPTVFWYARPDIKTNIAPDPESAKKKVVLEKSDFYSQAPDEDGRIEGEYLKTGCSSGNIREQRNSKYNWSKGAQVWWTDGQPGSKATLQFEIEDETSYNVMASFTKARDYGIVDIKLDGETVATNYDGYFAGGVTNQVVSLGEHVLSKGYHKLEVVIKGANPSAVKAYMFGIDYLDFLKIPTSFHEISNNSKDKLRAYPNPFSDEIFISGLNIENLKYEIFDINGGKKVEGKLEGVSLKRIDTEALHNGSYIINIEGNHSFKVVKMD